MNDGAEWVVYRLKFGHMNAVPRIRWDRWATHRPGLIRETGAELVAEGLTEGQARQFVLLAMEDE